MQKELFPVEISYKKYSEEEELRQCVKCGISKPLYLFTPARYGIQVDTMESFSRPGRTCKACTSSEKKLRIKLRELYPFPKNTNYRCLICNQNEEELTSDGRFSSNSSFQGPERVWHLDHCHKTKSFRGWLCCNCNQAIGKLNDSVECLKRAVKYLERDLDEH